jgi:energy-coupling factor transporter transmembrane protein EcfT
MLIYVYTEYFQFSLTKLITLVILIAYMLLFFHTSDFCGQVAVFTDIFILRIFFLDHYIYKAFIWIRAKTIK